MINTISIFGAPVRPSFVMASIVNPSVYPFVPNPTTVLTCVDSTTWIVMEINISQPHHLYDYSTRIMTCTKYFCIMRQQTKWFCEHFRQADNIKARTAWALSIQLDNRSTTSMQVAASTFEIDLRTRISPSQMSLASLVLLLIVVSWWWPVRIQL